MILIKVNTFYFDVHAVLTKGHFRTYNLLTHLQIIISHQFIAYESILPTSLSEKPPVSASYPYITSRNAVQDSSISEAAPR